jgi:hypothetical protein
MSDEIRFSPERFVIWLRYWGGYIGLQEEQIESVIRLVEAEIEKPTTAVPTPFIED